MTIREFVAKDGSSWTVWYVKAGSAGLVAGTPPEWLAFQNAQGTERCRVLEIPGDWTELSDEGLDLLRRTCVPVTLTTKAYSPPHGVEKYDPTEEGKGRPPER